jgi:hypothetical protein
LVPGPQSKPQANWLVGVGRAQLVTVFGGPAGQLVQLVPHESTLLSERHCMPHRWNPAWQVKSQTPTLQIAVPFAGGVHVRQLGPQVVTESATQTLLQKFGLVTEAQRRPQLVPSQVTVVPLPIGPSGHGEQRFPQVFTLKLVTHCPLHSWKPTLHWMPQLVPLQVAVPFSGEGHGVHEAPQVCTEVFDAHAEPH